MFRPMSGLWPIAQAEEEEDIDLDDDGMAGSRRLQDDCEGDEESVDDLEDDEEDGEIIVPVMTSGSEEEAEMIAVWKLLGKVCTCLHCPHCNLRLTTSTGCMVRTQTTLLTSYQSRFQGNVCC
jgi:hypothetical protein